MSVTIKLADRDAQLIGEILTTVGKLQEATINGKESLGFLKALDRQVGSTVMVNHVMELSSYFKVTVRANER